MRWGRLWQCWHASGETQAARFVIFPGLGLLQLGSFQRLTWCLLPDRTPCRLCVRQSRKFVATCARQAPPQHNWSKVQCRIEKTEALQSFEMAQLC